MSLFWKITLIVLSSFIIIAAGYFGFRYYKNYHQPHASAMSAISPASAVFAEIHDPRSWLSGLVHEKEWWQALLEIPGVQLLDKQSLQLDAAFSTDSWISEVLELQKFYVSVEKVSDSKFNFVFLLELSNGDCSSEIEDFITNEYDGKVLKKDFEYQQSDITSILILDLKKEFFYSVYKGLFIGSFEKQLVENSIDQVNAGIPVNFDKNFKRIEATAGKNVDANIFINHSSFSELLSLFAEKEKLPFVFSLANLGFWTETDLIIKNDELLINGYTVTSDTLNHLDCYKSTPQAVTIPEILPKDVVWMLDLGIGDLLKFHAGRKSMLGNDLSSYDQFLSEFKTKYKTDLLEEVYGWAGNEVALAEINKNQLAVFRTKDILKAVVSLDQISRKINKVKRKPEFSLNHGEYTIKKLNHSELLPFLFGPVFSSIKENYYLAIRDYIIFANSPNILKQVIDNFYNQKTLAQDVNYQSFSNNISDNSNIYLYLNIRKASEIADEYLLAEIANHIKSNKSILQKFEGLAVQFSYINQMFYTNIYLKYNPEYKEVNSLNWEYELEAPLFKKPVLIRNHRSDKLNVVAFDEKSNMYLLDHLGRLKWKLPLIEKPMSDIFMVDYYDNGKFQYLFNTENYVYLVDLNGNYVANFPAKLSTGATGPLNVFDYNNDKEYRIVIPLNDNKIYNLDINNNQIKGWNKIQSKAKVTSAVEHLVSRSKDYLFTTDENGSTIITNRKGEQRIKLKKSFKKAKNSSFYVNETNSKGIFITTDNKGKLVYISEEGKIQRTDFGDFTAEHFFLYEDFDKNGSADFIYLDGNKLVIFDRMKKELLHHEFAESISQKPIVFKHMGQTYLGVILPTANEIQIFNINGSVFSGQDILGSSLFSTGSLNNDNKLNIVTGKENKVINYLIN